MGGSFETLHDFSNLLRCKHFEFNEDIAPALDNVFEDEGDEHAFKDRQGDLCYCIDGKEGLPRDHKTAVRCRECRSELYRCDNIGEEVRDSGNEEHVDEYVQVHC